MTGKLQMAVLALVLATPAAAQETGGASMGHDSHAAPSCPADAEPLAPALAGWTARSALTAATGPAKLDGARVATGKGVDLALAPTPEVQYVTRPENPGGSVSHGGMVSFTVEAAGTYRIGISSAAWIEVVRDGAALTSVGHGRGPACSGLRKMVDFALQPGSYIVEIAGNGAPTIGLIVARLP